MTTNVVTKHPGIYIEELASLSLAVSSSATAVPVFAVDDANTAFTTPVRITSWLEYSKLAETARTAVLNACMQAYFVNGGGYCYLCNTSRLAEAVPKLNDVTLLVAAGQDLESQVPTLCAPGLSRFAILDGRDGDSPVDDPIDNGDGTTTAAPPVPEITQFANAAVYYPWLSADWAGVNIPPSAAMAGVYCRVDATRGVWKAPANVVLQGGLRPTVAVTDDLQGQHTKVDTALNMLRVFDGGGTTVWGARTRDNSEEWRYIPVRRLFDAAERDIKAAMRTAMYEPNSQPTWEKTSAAITNYLYKLWRRGALAGETEAEAFFVQVGKDITMDQTQINQGEMIVKVGMAAVRPAEFIILQFTQEMGQ